MSRFIDIDEIEEMLGEYYDFSSFTEEQWNKVDDIVRKECGNEPCDDYDEYARICDGAVAEVVKC